MILQYLQRYLFLVYIESGCFTVLYYYKELKKGYLDGVTGEYTPPQGYFVNEAEAEEFDRQFPKKEMLKLPT